MCLKAFETDEPLDTARQAIIIGYVLFKALNRVNPGSINAFLNCLEKWLIVFSPKSDKTPSTATLSFLSMFSKVIQRSTLVTDNLDNSDFKYAQIKTLVLQREGTHCKGPKSQQEKRASLDGQSSQEPTNQRFKAESAAFTVGTPAKSHRTRSGYPGSGR